MGTTGYSVEKAPGPVGIALNKNAIPNDPKKPMVNSGIRFGTAALILDAVRQGNSARARHTRSAALLA